MHKEFGRDRSRRDDDQGVAGVRVPQDASPLQPEPAGASAREPQSSSESGGFEAPAGEGVDNVNSPAHYVGDGGIESIDVINGWGLGFELGNACKYILRYQAKGRPGEDLAKACWYFRHGIGGHQLTLKPRGARPNYKEVCRAFDLPAMALGCIEQIALAPDTLVDFWLQAAVDYLEEEIASFKQGPGAVTGRRRLMLSSVEGCENVVALPSSRLSQFRPPFPVADREGGA